MKWNHGKKLSDGERKERYKLLRALDYSPDWARRIRDWQPCHYRMAVERKGG